MPHVVVKMYAGRTDDTKRRLAEAISRVVVEIAGTKPSSVSVAIEEYDPDEWTDRVYRPDVLEAGDTLILAPGYDPFEG